MARQRARRSESERQQGRGLAAGEQRRMVPREADGTGLAGTGSAAADELGRGPALEPTLEREPRWLGARSLRVHVHEAAQTSAKTVRNERKVQGREELQHDQGRRDQRDERGATGAGGRQLVHRTRR